MGFITIQAEFHQMVAVLGRIADALDRAYPPAMMPDMRKPAGIEALGKLDLRKKWQKEREASLKEAPEMPDASEPNS